MATTYPVFDTARMDCDRETLATGSIGQAATEAEARALIQTSYDAADWMGAPTPKVVRVEFDERLGVCGWFPAAEE